ncbi:E3 ubiquitin-protein ligase [Takifugu flavidus]|uniref:E3 ubiquitin-protein ligase n=1 Tax=Takifugu flavidus TaxID=433684 RepID=A0A5C6P7F4_9TELE|nr:E3 ubiquitin-protein ligase [Takifugu flavidus]
MVVPALLRESADIHHGCECTNAFQLLPESRSQADSRPQRACGARPSHFCCYDLDDLDVAWLELVNHEFRRMALPELDELTMEYVLVELESMCEEKMRQAIETEEGLGIEYDEDVVCDVCRSPEGEDGNEMVFCDKCNVCVHQACYGILKVPRGNWLCRTCALGVQPKCLLCPKRGGALKPTRSGTKWVHVSCALWIPEVSIGCPEKMEPITKVSHIPASRWALSCSLCREHTGTCIQEPTITVGRFPPRSDHEDSSQVKAWQRVPPQRVGSPATGRPGGAEENRTALSPSMITPHGYMLTLKCFASPPSVVPKRAEQLGMAAGPVPE